MHLPVLQSQTLSWYKNSHALLYQNTSTKKEYTQARGPNNRNIYKVPPYAKCDK
jgi:hypothetical protein